MNLTQTELGIAARFHGIPNEVTALYAICEKKGLFGTKRRIVQIRAWGQLCFDDAACNAIASHWHNYAERDDLKDWIPVSWKCEVNGPLIGNAKKSGTIPKGFLNGSNKETI